MSSMRILMTVSSTSLMDGINRHVRTIASALNALEGVEVGVVTLHSWGDFNDALKAEGVKCWSLDCVNGHQLKAIPNFCRVMREFKPDLIHSHVMAIAERICLGALYRHVPIVTTCHGITDFESGVRAVTVRDRFEAFVGRFLPGKISQTIFISQGVATAKGHSNGTVIYNPVPFHSAGVDNGHDVLRQELELAPDAQIVGTSCRISPQKQPEVFTRVMCKVLQRIPNAHAVVCGRTEDVTLKKTLEHIVSDAGVESRFHWLGYRKDAPQLVREFDCFVMTSVTEGLPTALLEAMSVRTPIAFMRGKGGLIDLDELNKKEGPFAVESDPGYETVLADGICDLLNRPETAANYARCAFEVCRRHFETAAVAASLQTVYSELLRKYPRKE